MTQIAIRARLTEIITEYNEKKELLSEELHTFQKAGTQLKSASTVWGQWGRETVDVGNIYIETLERALLCSAWLALYEKLELKTLMSADDKRLFDQAMSRPPEFTLDNIKATFGDYIADPWGNILRGLAEVFCGLDQSYKSHDKVKIGVSGLPKRIIMGGFGGYSSYGYDRVRDIINALAAYQGKPLAEWAEMNALQKNGEALIKGWVHTDNDGKEKPYPGRGLWLHKFKNGNGHLFFDPETLKDINRALAEYYGEVLADCHEEKPTDRATSTEVSKDLQYYPTPEDTVRRVLRDIYIRDNDRVLEPSCGCGRFLDQIRKETPKAKLWGIEIDPTRAAQARAKGHDVLVANFLQTKPEPVYDVVIMNPPFYGKHYAKHVEHALKFLKPGGILKAILPITARTDHGLFDGRGEFHDLPVGSFRESGTNINTTVLTIRKKD